MRFRKKVIVDFDGVLHKYTSPWTYPEEVHDGPTEGARKAVQSYINAGFDVVVMSSRASCHEGREAIRHWLYQHGFPDLRVTHEKEGGVLYIDDRGYRFTGSNWPSAEFVKNFKPWNKQLGDVEPYIDEEATNGVLAKVARVRDLKEVILNANVPESDMPDLIQELCDLLDEVLP